MIKVRNDLTGKKFDRLTVVKQVEDYISSSSKHESNWLCVCECGNFIKVTRSKLTSGNTRSCGCLRKETAIKNNKKHKKKYNNYDLSNDYGIGYTFKGEEFYFDLEDYDKIKDYCWRMHNKGYVACSINRGKIIPKKDLLMHVLVMNGYDDNLETDKSIEIDHVNGKDSRNDNRKFNLRKCTHQENMCNYPTPSHNTSGRTGVSWDNTHSKWVAYITYKGKRKSLGSFNNFENAVAAREKAEEEYFGEYSYNNSIKLSG